ncbi:RNA polymerase sigma factor [Chitinophaga sp. 30R24]|uniref:RNA polymerase sigma factor n=1 Tax=Chitinophaga sp. 30R24 TaxID=3248838 RepID=UPI003B8F4C5B
MSPSETVQGMTPEERFKDLYLNYWDILYQIANKKTGDAQDALDLVQDTFTYVWQQFPQLELEGSKTRSYLITCLYYRIFGWLRANGLKGKHLQHFQAYLENELSIDPHYNVQDMEAELTAINIAIAGELDRMPERMKQIFVMHRYENRSVEEIAALYGISPKTVKNQLSDAMRRLKNFADSYPATTMLPFLALFIKS